MIGIMKLESVDAYICILYNVHEIQVWDMASVKFYSAIFEIAVDKQTRAATEILRGSRTPTAKR